jgi:hypothetical protein
MAIEKLFKLVSEQAEQKGVFAEVKLEAQQLICQAKTDDPDTKAWYKLTVGESDDIHVGVYTQDRWLSESIETDLVEHKDDIEDLLADEMYELGIDEGLGVFHFRDEDLQYVFRSQILMPADQAVDCAEFVDYVTKVLLAYESTFNQLGDLVCEDAM